jgi:hypothetical protein
VLSWRGDTPETSTAPYETVSLALARSVPPEKEAKVPHPMPVDTFCTTLTMLLEEGMPSGVLQAMRVSLQNIMAQGRRRGDEGPG